MLNNNCSVLLQKWVFATTVPGKLVALTQENDLELILTRATLTDPNHCTNGACLADSGHCGCMFKGKQNLSDINQHHEIWDVMFLETLVNIQFSHNITTAFLPSDKSSETQLSIKLNYDSWLERRVSAVWSARSSCACWVQIRLGKDSPPLFSWGRSVCHEQKSSCFVDGGSKLEPNCAQELAVEHWSEFSVKKTVEILPFLVEWKRKVTDRGVFFRKCATKGVLFLFGLFQEWNSGQLHRYVAVRSNCDNCVTFPS